MKCVRGRTLPPPLVAKLNAAEDDEKKRVSAAMGTGLKYDAPTTWAPAAAAVVAALRVRQVRAASSR